MKRRVAIVGLALLAGAIVTVGVAWTCALWPRETTTGPCAISPETLTDRWTALAPASWHDSEDLSGLDASGLGWDRVWMLGSRRSDPDGDGRARFGSAYLVRWQMGLPFRALRSEFYGERNNRHETFETRGALLLHRTADRAGGVTHVPWLPLWPGAALNTGVYATAFLLLVFVPRHVRRTWRDRHGRCVACGYPAGATNVCSECGADLPVRIAAS